MTAVRLLTVRAPCTCTAQRNEWPLILNFHDLRLQTYKNPFTTGGELRLTVESDVGFRRDQARSKPQSPIAQARAPTYDTHRDNLSTTQTPSSTSPWPSESPTQMSQMMRPHPRRQRQRVLRRRARKLMKVSAILCVHVRMDASPGSLVVET